MSKIDSWYDEVPAITTERLVLRPFVKEDFSAIKQLYQDLSLYRFLGRSRNVLEKHPEYLFDRGKYDPKKVNMLRWGIAIESTNQIIGEIMLYDIKEDAACRMGCRVAKAYQRKGVATEATKAMTSYFYKEGVFPTLEADVMKGNKASYRALEKSGFKPSGKTLNKKYDIYFYEYPNEK